MSLSTFILSYSDSRASDTPSISSSSVNQEIDQNSLQMLLSMGFDEFDSRNALQEANNNVETAVQILMG